MLVNKLCLSAGSAMNAVMQQSWALAVILYLLPKEKC